MPLGRKNRELDAEELRLISSLTPTPTAVTDHGGLAGLTDDDHSQYVHLSAARTITAAHTFAPAAPGVPFALGANAQGQLVTGLYADQLSKQVIAGNGLTGGGALTADRTLNVGAGDGIDVAADAVAVDVTDFIDTAAGLKEDASNNIQLNVGAAFTFTTGALVLADGVAGGGLTLSSQILAVGAGDGIDVAADSVAVDVTDFIDTSYGLTENTNNIRVNLGTGLTFSSGAVVLAWSGTPGTIVPDAVAAEGSSSYAARVDHTHGIAGAIAGSITPDASAAEGTATSFSRSDHVHGITCAAPAAALSVSTTDAEGDATTFSRSNHSHAITASADVGTTPAAALLKSTAGGGLTLATLAVKGSVDITNGGDLTVGTNVFFVDVSGSNVGINCAPDAQFDLDIAGNLRVQGWIVGKHALQIKGALILLHYDGPGPYTTNYRGEVNGHAGQVGTPLGGAIFRHGKYDKGLQIAEATTNLTLNPSFELDAVGAAPTGWTTHASNTLAVSSDFVYLGEKSCKVTMAATSTLGLYVGTSAFTAAATYVLSGYVRRADGAEVTSADISDIFIENTNVGVAYIEEAYDGWYRVVSAPRVAAATGNSNYGFRCGLSRTLYVDAVQLEAKGYATPYCDGTLGGYSATGTADGTGHAWSGTAHNSSSSRLLSSISYNSYAASLVGVTGTAFGYCSVASSGVRVMFDVRGADNNNRIQLSMQADHKFDLYINGANRIVNVGSGTWQSGYYLWFVTWNFDTDAYTLSVYEPDGSLATGSDTTALTMPAGLVEMNFGTAYELSYPINGVMDECGILNRALSATEMEAIYESDAPVFAETSTFHFRAGGSLVWADAEGLWMRDVDGNAVFGLCGVDGKSWGGLTLNKGDQLLGYYGASDGGWVFFDRDGVNSDGLLSIGYSDQTIMRFDDGGASLYGVLDIDTNGGIYQGTGTFASPTTGLKVWNDTGVGRIAGYNTGTLQAGFGTDGKLTAGAGNVLLSAAGATFLVPAGAAFQETSAVTFKDGSARVHGFVQGYGDASNSGLLLWANDHSARDTSIDIRAQAGDTEDATITLYALRGSGATNYPYIEISSVDAGNSITIDPGASTDVVSIAGVLDVAGALYAASLSTDNGTTKWTLGGYTASVPTVEGYLEVVVESVTYRIAVERV